MPTDSNEKVGSSVTDSNQVNVPSLRVLYAEAVYDEREIEAVLRVLKERPQRLMDGPAVREFEGRIAAMFGKRHGVMTNSGSSANLLALAALKLPRDSEVITPACTFSTTAAPIVQVGLVPAFVDVDASTFQIDAELVEEMITPKTRAMMIPNLIGNLPDWTRLRAIADVHGLAVIEDSADTVGSLLDGGPTGRLTDVSTTSFYASHVMTCAGFGGMLSCHDPAVLRQAQLLRGWGRSSALTRESEQISDRFGVSVDGVGYDNKFLFEALGYNFLPSEIGAAFGLVQLEKLSRYLDVRIQNFETLRRFFSTFEEWFVLPRQAPNVRTGWLALPLIVRDDAPFSRRDLQIHFESAGIQTRPIFAGNILRHGGFANITRRVSPGGYPNADRIMRGGILLGCHQGMNAVDIAFICDVFSRFASQAVTNRQA
jgi:CDP-6-deoxy-D-xylo-4-hexulose-3-dehydrase